MAIKMENVDVTAVANKTTDSLSLSLSLVGLHLLTVVCLAWRDKGYPEKVQVWLRQ